MAQFDVYRNPNQETASSVPFLVDLQSDLLEPMATRVVAPLFRATVVSRPASTLMPDFVVEGTDVVLSTPELAGVSRAELGPHVGTLADHRQEIIAALDLLFTGI